MEQATVLVYGAGAVGCLLGGLLARAGHAVTLLGRPNRMDPIRAYGLKIDGLWGTHHITSNLEAHSDVASVRHRRFDIALVTVKAYDTTVVADQLSHPDGPACEVVVSVQNGYGNVEALAERLGKQRVLGARIITGVEVIAPAHVRVTVSADAIRIGPPFGDDSTWPLAQRLAELLRAASIPAEPTRQYREYLWDKILYNAALNPLGALLQATYGELAADARVRQIMDAVIREAYAVLNELRIPRFSASAREYLERFYGELIPATAEHYPSMLADLRQRARTEIDALNGAIVRLGAGCQVATPVNEMLTAMVHLRERTRQRELTAGG